MSIPRDVVLTARATGLSAYDASYLWLAGFLGADLVTLDARLARAGESVIRSAVNHDPQARRTWCATDIQVESVRRAQLMSAAALGEGSGTNTTI